MYISVHECMDLSGKPFRKSSNYDWFASVCLIIFQNSDMTFMFLSKFAKRPEAFYLWYEKSRTLAYPESSQLYHPVLVISELVEYILRFEYEESFQFFQMQGLSPLPLVIGMISQFFLNWLNLDDVCNVLMLTIFKGVDWIVYVCVCCLHHLAHLAIKETDPCCDLRQLSQWKRNFQALKGFNLNACIGKMQEMENMYRPMCLQRMALVHGSHSSSTGSKNRR
uniref:BROMI C-terminal Rab TBC-like domain-containing protein n=1 Tax=Percolomonas cosmopolitus TaxID=63605 RepID=A0A7S1PGX0_9EUKA